MAQRGVSVKTLKRMLKKKGLKTTGRKAALTRRAKKAKLMKGGGGPGCQNDNGVVCGTSCFPQTYQENCPPLKEKKGWFSG
jgi:hypothetical protein